MLRESLHCRLRRRTMKGYSCHIIQVLPLCFPSGKTVKKSKVSLENLEIGSEIRNYLPNENGKIKIQDQ